MSSALTERQEEILKKLMKNEIAAYSDLSIEFQVSEMTIRRDVEDLLEKNLVQKSKPGLIELKKGFRTDPGYDKRHQLNLKEKVSIALEASKLIEDDMVLGIDGSSTSYEFSKFLINYSNLTIVTTSLSIPTNFINQNQIDIVLPGGHVRNDSFTLTGHHAIEGLQKYFYNYVFFSIDAIDNNWNLTDTNDFGIPTKLALMKNAKKKVLLADSSKFEQLSYCFCCKLTDIDILITDNKINKEIVENIKKTGIQVIIAEV